MNFRVQLDDYTGPLDLLLYLVRRHEIDLVTIPLSAVTDQFLSQVEVLEQLAVDDIGDFLDVATMLIEIKSRLVLPQAPVESDEPVVDEPRDRLVQRLLDFKQLRDASIELQQRGELWHARFSRLANDLPTSREAAEVATTGVAVWDLVSAFGRVIREKLAPPQVETIRYDETPIHVFMERMHAQVSAVGRVEFFALFPEAVHKSTLVGMFLALLELVRYRHLLAEQPERYGEIWLTPGPEPLHAAATLRLVAAAEGA